MITKGFLGECVAVVGKHIYGLRPSFAALWEIEQHTGLIIPQVIAHIDSPQCRAVVVRLVVEQGIIACKPDAALPKLYNRQWLGIREAAITLLIQGLGYHITQAVSHASPRPTVVADMLPASPTMPEADAELSTPTCRFEPLDWPQLYKTATGLLGKTEAEFWQMTLCGLMLQCEAYAAAQGIEIMEVGHPATPDDLHRMMQQFPDVIAA